MGVIEIYRGFMHREPRREFVINLPDCKRAPRALALLGKLIQIRVPLDGLHITHHWYARQGALLLCTGMGRLYAYCPSGLLLSSPRVLSVRYLCDKGEGRAVYKHAFKRPPRLVVVAGSRDKLARFAGGAYRIESKGISG